MNECFDGSSAQKAAASCSAGPAASSPASRRWSRSISPFTGRRGRPAVAAHRGRGRARRRSASASAASSERLRPRRPGCGRGGEYTRPTLAGSATEHRDRPRVPDRGHRRRQARRDAACACARAPRPRAARGRWSRSRRLPARTQGPTPTALLAAIPMLSLTAGRRYLLADGVEAWSAKQAAPVAEALAALPPDVTVVLVAREQPPKRKAPKTLADAVAANGGEVLSYAAPKPRDLPRWLIDEARRRGFELEPDAAPAARRAHGRRAPRGSPPSSTGWRCGPSAGRPVDPRRPRSDGRRHLRGGRLGALGRARRPRCGDRAGGGRAAHRPGRGA